LKAALVLIDLQKHFLGMNKRAFTRKIIPNTRELLEHARGSDLMIVHAITRYAVDKSDWPEAFKARDSIWCLAGSEEAEILEELGPATRESLVIKKRFTAFYKTDLDALLKSAAIDTLFICGYSADGCVRFSTMDAYNEGYSIFWLTDCMDSAFESFGKSLKYMKRLTRLKAITNEEFYEILRRQERALS
jgi:nicotinamidase-related amidase